MTSLLRHRGPDQEGVFISDDNLCALGNTRLAIVDPNCRISLPIKSSDNRNIITFNGEIYNFKEIKKELSAKDITFKSNSDTEVILEAYKLWGLDFVKKLRGMFAFAIWDSIKKNIEFSESFNSFSKIMMRLFFSDSIKKLSNFSKTWNL